MVDLYPWVCLGYGKPKQENSAVIVKDSLGNDISSTVIMESLFMLSKFDQYTHTQLQLEILQMDFETEGEIDGRLPQCGAIILHSPRPDTDGQLVSVLLSDRGVNLNTAKEITGWIGDTVSDELARRREMFEKTGNWGKLALPEENNAPIKSAPPQITAPDLPELPPGIKIPPKPKLPEEYPAPKSPELLPGIKIPPKPNLPPGPNSPELPPGIKIPPGPKSPPKPKLPEECHPEENTNTPTVVRGYCIGGDPLYAHTKNMLGRGINDLRHELNRAGVETYGSGRKLTPLVLYERHEYEHMVKKKDDKEVKERVVTLKIHTFGATHADLNTLRPGPMLVSTVENFANGSFDGVLNELRKTPEFYQGPLTSVPHLLELVDTEEKSEEFYEKFQADNPGSPRIICATAHNHINNEDYSLHLVLSDWQIPGYRGENLVKYNLAMSRALRNPSDLDSFLADFSYLTERTIVIDNLMKESEGARLLLGKTESRDGKQVYGWDVL